MSRFFASGDTDSDSDSQYSDNELGPVAEVSVDAKFMYESSSEDEEKRVVRSQKDKRFDEMLNVVKSMKNHMKINDWVSISNDYDTLQKQLTKAKNVIKKEGIPRFYFKAMLNLQDVLKEAYAKLKTDKKKFNASNARALNGMRQKFRKTIKQYEREIEVYKKNPLLSDEEDEAPKRSKKKKVESDSEADSDEEPAKPTKSSPASDDESDEDNDDNDDDSESWDSDSDDDFSDDDDDDVIADVGVGGEEANNMNQKAAWFKRDYWVKKAPSDEATGKKKKDKKARDQTKKKKVKSEETAKPIEKKPEEKEFTPEMVVKKLKELLAMRGKRTTDRHKMIEDLRFLATKATIPASLLQIRTTLCSALFDISLNKGTHMDVGNWRQCYKELLNMIELLGTNLLVRLSENEDVQGYLDDFDDMDEDEVFAVSGVEVNKTEEELEKEAEEKRKKEEEEEKMKEKGEEICYVIGNLFSFVEQMCVEYKKSLQNIDPHSPEYIDRLKDEAELRALIRKARTYYSTIDKVTLESRMVLELVELDYYHYHPEFDMLNTTAKPKEVPAGEKNAFDTVGELCSFLYANGDSSARTRGLLSHIYFLSLHNRFEAARDMMLMSHIQDAINDSDIKTRIHYNRSMAQLGLCAFRTGTIKQALSCLADLYQTSKIKELLAQGVNIRYHDRDHKREQVEKRRQYPYHQHMNLDMLEAVHLISAMFLEVPNLAIHGNNRRRMISKTFRRHFEHSERQAFTGPPENTRDLVMASAKALRLGDWETCAKHVSNLRMWALMPEGETVKARTVQLIKEEALRTYLLSFAERYTSVELISLGEMFSLSKSVCFRIVSQLMVEDQLHAIWDQATECIIMQSTPTNKLQRAALAYAEKIGLFVEQNEKLIDHRPGYYKSQDKKWDNNYHKKDFSSYNRNRSW